MRLHLLPRLSLFVFHSLRGTGEQGVFARQLMPGRLSVIRLTPDASSPFREPVRCGGDGFILFTDKTL